MNSSSMLSSKQKNSYKRGSMKKRSTNILQLAQEKISQLKEEKKQEDMSQSRQNNSKLRKSTLSKIISNNHKNQSNSNSRQETGIIKQQQQQQQHLQQQKHDKRSYSSFGSIKQYSSNGSINEKKKDQKKNSLRPKVDSFSQMTQQQLQNDSNSDEDDDNDEDGDNYKEDDDNSSSSFSMSKTSQDQSPKQGGINKSGGSGNISNRTVKQRFRLNISTSSDENMNSSLKNISQDDSLEEKNAKEVMTKVILKKQLSNNNNANNNNAYQGNNNIQKQNSKKHKLKEAFGLLQNKSEFNSINITNSISNPQQDMQQPNQVYQNLSKRKKEKWQETMYIQSLSQNQNLQKSIQISEITNNKKIKVQMKVSNYFTFQRLQHEQSELQRMYNDFKHNSEDMQKQLLINQQLEQEKHNTYQARKSDHNGYTQLGISLAKKYLRQEERNSTTKLQNQGLKTLLGGVGNTSYRSRQGSQSTMMQNNSQQDLSQIDPNEMNNNNLNNNNINQTGQYLSSKTRKLSKFNGKNSIINLQRSETYKNNNSDTMLSYNKSPKHYQQIASATNLKPINKQSNNGSLIFQE